MMFHMERYEVYYVGDKYSTVRLRRSAAASNLCVSMHGCTNTTEKVRFNHNLDNLEASLTVLGSLLLFIKHRWLSDLRLTPPLTEAANKKHCVSCLIGLIGSETGEL